LNFDDKTAREGIRYAHDRGRKVLMAINTYAQGADISRWKRAVDNAAELGVDAVILADLGLMDYAVKRHPDLRLHLSVQGSATHHEAINLARDLFGVRRAVLPRVLTLDQVKQVIEHTDVEIEVFGFGSLCVMVEGRCLLSSYATGESPNTHGVCSPARFVRWEHGEQSLNARLNDILIDQYDKDESAGYPTLCKGRFQVRDETYYALEEPTSLNVLSMLPELIAIGVAAIKIEGRQRSPAYVAQVTRTLREALDAARDAQRFSVRSSWQQSLDKVSEGHQQTLGAYSRPWK
jgi:putative protease